MKDGFLRAAAAAPVLHVADCRKNAGTIREYISKAAEKDVKLLVLPELCITGYALGDLFLQGTLLRSAEDCLAGLVRFSASFDMVIVAGVPVRYGACLYSCASVFQRGRLLGIVPKRHIPNYSEFYEARHFSSGTGVTGTVRFAGFKVPFGADLLFRCETMPDFVLGVEICEDLWVPAPPSSMLCQAGATVIANCSASTYVTGKESYRSNLVGTQSARCISGYVYSSCGEGESSTDLVYSGHLLVYENGRMLSDTSSDKMAVNDIDTGLLMSERRRMRTFADEGVRDEYRVVPFSLDQTDFKALLRPIARQPFVPEQDAQYRERCREVLNIQCAGLAKRLSHTKSATAVVAVSGGLDSTLALLVAGRAIQKYNLSCKIIAITMPGPGTTGRTRGNAGSLCEALHAEMREIPISDAVTSHLSDIGHQGSHDVTYENAQARERYQIAFDVANMTGGIVVGTGDMSELALGFTTYNGDHMSNYGVNSGVPKSLVKHLVSYYADTTDNKQ
ncbi:MAG TPA: NAD(+) synthase, partial [Armatimonadota bacterium]|nr:NAD(+) synthase [Armatimonadota bacterium]